MNFEDLKDSELQARLKSAKTPEELLAIAKGEGYELTDEELNSVAGGIDWLHECSNKGTCGSYCENLCNQFR